eukprot:scaffold157808_cov40-Prasinocladus_malaysianus.AAC.1
MRREYFNQEGEQAILKELLSHEHLELPASDNKRLTVLNAGERVQSQSFVKLCNQQYDSVSPSTRVELKIGA